MNFYKRPGEMEEYSDFKKRIRKTTYQSKNLKFDRPSLAMTEFAVDYLRDLAPRELGRIDMYWASSMCQESYVSPCTLMVALMYARRLKMKNSQYLDTVPSSNLLLVSMMVASKFLVEVDETTLEEWMKASNMDHEDIYEMEMDFLKAIDWNLFITNNDFWYFLNHLEQRIAWRQYLGRENKFFTYTELQVLTKSQDSFLWSTIVQTYFDIVKVFLTCAATYTLMALTLASLPLLLKTRMTGVENFPPGRVLNTKTNDPATTSEDGTADILPLQTSASADANVSLALDPLVGFCCFSCPVKICLGTEPNPFPADDDKKYLNVDRREMEDLGSCSVPYDNNCLFNFTTLRVSEAVSLSRLIF